MGQTCIPERYLDCPGCILVYVSQLTGHKLSFSVFKSVTHLEISLKFAVHYIFAEYVSLCFQIALLVCLCLCEIL